MLGGGLVAEMGSSLLESADKDGVDTFFFGDSVKVRALNFDGLAFALGANTSVGVDPSELAVSNLRHRFVSFSIWAAACVAALCGSFMHQSLLGVNKKNA